MHREHVGVTFHHIHHILFGNLLLCLEDTIQFVGFMVDEGIGRIDIFLIDTLGARIQHTSTKGNHLAVDRNPGEHGTSTETVIDSSVVTFHTKSRIHQIFLIISLCLRLLRHGIGAIETETQTELGNDVITETTTAEISQTDGTSILVIHHDLAEILGSPLIDGKHTFPFVHPLTLFVSHLLLFNGNAIFLCQMFQCLDIRHLFHLHDEMDRVATLATTEALTHASGRGNRKRWGFIVVERTQSLVACASSAKRDVIGDDVNDVGGINDSVDGGLWYQVLIRLRNSFRFSMFSNTPV